MIATEEGTHIMFSLGWLMMGTWWWSSQEIGLLHRGLVFYTIHCHHVHAFTRSLSGCMPTSATIMGNHWRIFDMKSCNFVSNQISNASFKRSASTGVFNVRKKITHTYIVGLKIVGEAGGQLVNCINPKKINTSSTNSKQCYFTMHVRTRTNTTYSFVFLLHWRWKTNVWQRALGRSHENLQESDIAIDGLYKPHTTLVKAKIEGGTYNSWQTKDCTPLACTRYVVDKCYDMHID